jgi:hypothetical protein
LARPLIFRRIDRTATRSAVRTIRSELLATSGSSRIGIESGAKVNVGFGNPAIATDVGGD